MYLDYFIETLSKHYDIYMGLFWKYTEKNDRQMANYYAGKGQEALDIIRFVKEHHDLLDD